MCDLVTGNPGVERWLADSRAQHMELKRSKGYRYALLHDKPAPGSSLTERIEFFRNRAIIRMDGMERGRIAKPRQEFDDEDGRPMFDSGLHLYLVEMVGVCVKIGITDDPQKRIAAHRAQARKLGREVGRNWVTRRHLEATDNELILRGDSRTEYLAQSFDALIAQADQLDMTFSDDDE